MADLPKTIKKIRAKTRPQSQEDFAERTDAAWQLWGKSSYEKSEAAKYAQEHPPIPEPVPAMPDPEAMDKARKRAAASRSRRGGRVSTIFTMGDGLGG